MSIIIAYFLMYVLSSTIFIVNDQHIKKTGSPYFKPVKLSTCIFAFIGCVTLFVILGLIGMRTM